MKTRFLIFFAALMLSACSTYTLVEPQRHQVSEVYSVESPIQWNRIKSGGSEVWTADGPLLQALRFYDGIQEGKPLFQTYGQQKKQPLFRAGMSATEIQEFVVDTIAAGGMADVSASNLRPFQFGALPGFRFEIQYLSAEGLEHDGIVAGATRNDRLYLIVYTGTRSHYFGKHRPHVERILESIQIKA